MSAAAASIMFSYNKCPKRLSPLLIMGENIFQKLSDFPLAVSGSHASALTEREAGNEASDISVFTIQSGLCRQGGEVEERSLGNQQYPLPRIIISDLPTRLAIATSVFLQSKLGLEAESFDKNVNSKNLPLASHCSKNKSMILKKVDKGLHDLVSAYLFSPMFSGPSPIFEPHNLQLRQKQIHTVQETDSETIPKIKRWQRYKLRVI